MPRGRAAEMTARRVVVGLGSPDRGDDAVGPVAAQLVAGLALPGVLVLAYEDPTGLLEVWRGMELAVVIDAVRSGAPPGSLAVVEVGGGLKPLSDHAWARTGRAGTRASGLAAAVELGRALHSLPQRLVLVGVEAVQLEDGEPLSDPVAAALDAVISTAVGIMTGHGDGHAGALSGGHGHGHAGAFSGGDGVGQVHDHLAAVADAVV